MGSNRGDLGDIDGVVSLLSEVLGGRQVRLYPESMVDWSRSGREMANVPTRLQQFLMQLRAAFGAG